MKITVWGINYHPEVTGIGPFNTLLCRFLKDRGHQVRMVTGFSYYPHWRKNPADRRQWYRTDSIDQVPVHRCWLHVPRRPGALHRILHEASFVSSSILRLILLPRADVYVVVSPPLLAALAASGLGRIKGAPVVVHVQDLQPDAALGLGMLQQGWLVRLLFALEKAAYAGASRVSGISPGMIQAFRAKGVAEEKLIFFPNGVVLPDPQRLPPPGRFRQRLGLGADDFLLVYSGNLGIKQGLDDFLECFGRLNHQRLNLVICGDGAALPRLRLILSRLGLTQVRLLPLQEEARYVEMLHDMDLALIPQQKGASSWFFPSKLLRCLGMAKPVLVVAGSDCELSQLAQQHGFGLCVEPGDGPALAQALDQLLAQPPLLGQMGRAGRRFVEQFELNRVLTRFESQLLALRAEQDTPRTRCSLPAGSGNP